MKGYWKNVKEASNCIRKQIASVPAVGMITDIYLVPGDQTFSFEQTLAYRDIPNIAAATSVDHGGRIIVANVDGQQLLVFQGRFKLYEGYSALETVFPVRVMKNLGVKHLIVTDVGGGVNPDFNPGDIMLIQDHINLTGENPLIGTNHDSWGERFPDMSRVYDVTLAPVLEEIVRYEKMDMRKGVYAGRPGPSLEAPGDVPFLKTIGADAVGFATILEVIAAVHSGMKITGLSIISDIENLYHSPHDRMASILEAANDAAPVISMLTSKIVSESGARN